MEMFMFKEQNDFFTVFLRLQVATDEELGGHQMDTAQRKNAESHIN